MTYETESMGKTLLPEHTRGTSDLSVDTTLHTRRKWTERGSSEADKGLRNHQAALQYSLMYGRYKIPLQCHPESKDNPSLPDHKVLFLPNKGTNEGEKNSVIGVGNEGTSQPNCPLRNLDTKPKVKNMPLETLHEEGKGSILEQFLIKFNGSHEPV